MSSFFNSVTVIGFMLLAAVAIVEINSASSPARAPQQAGCSDYDCECHPDAHCNPPFSKLNPCHETDPNGCYGPVIGTFFTIALNNSIVQSLLPSGLQLAAIPDWNEPNARPISFFFNQQQNVGPWNYLEFILLVTYIEWDDAHAGQYLYRGPFGYGAKLYLDTLAPTIAGQDCGINKEWVNVTQSCDANGNCAYNVYHQGFAEHEHENEHTNDAQDQQNEIAQPRIMNAQWTVPSTASSANHYGYMNASMNAKFMQFQAPAFALPTIGEYPVNSGVFQCQETNWFIPNALIQPVTGSMTIDESFLGTLPAGTYAMKESINENGRIGAYRMETMWMFDRPCSPAKETCTKFVPNA